jgi:tetratricopeptide (TPR) repeat protein
MAKTKLGAFCDKLIEAGWLMAVIVTPLLFNVYSSRVFEPDKITALRSIAVVMAVAWLIKTIEHGFQSDEEQKAFPQELGNFWRRAITTPLVLPTLVLMIVYLAATILSVVPRVSLLGSYQRLQGTYSMFSYIVIFFMMLQGLRTREQVERFVTTTVLTSIPVALYGIIQHSGRDPLPWGGDVRTRVAGHMGNPIFIAAYLIMALPLTLYRTVESFNVILTSEESRFVDIVLGASYIFILAIQGVCLIWTQSRGPWLGMVGGLFFFFLVFAVVRRWRWLVWGVVIVVLAVAAFLVVFNLPFTPLDPLRKAPYIGRLGRVLDKNEGTSKVRLLIWQGAIDMILPHPALERPDGARDWMNPLRSFIGYGPESMYVAYNRFYPPDLAHYEARNASPDRSHNETFDSLVITGLVGFLVYMWLFASVFYSGFRWLGVIASDAQRNFFIGCWIGGGIAGAALMGVWQGAEFVGVGLPAGIAAGLGLYLVVWGLFLSQGSDPDVSGSQASNPYNLLVVALVSAIIAHFVEIHFGIAIGATRAYFWAYAGLLVIVGCLLPRQWEIERAIAERKAAELQQARQRRRKKSRRAQKQERIQQDALAGLKAVVPYALMLALILSTLAYDFVSNQKQLDAPQQVLWMSLTQRNTKQGWSSSLGILVLVGITWLLGSTIVVSEWLRQGGKGNWYRPLQVCLAISLFVAFLFALILAGRLVSVIRQKQLLDQTRLILGMLSSYYVLMMVLMLLSAWSMLHEVSLPRRFWQPMIWLLYPLLLAGTVLLVVNSNLRVVHADMTYKQAEPYERQRLWDVSIILHQQSIKRAPLEDFYYLFLGRAFLEKAKSTPATEQPPRQFKWSEILRMSPQQLAELSRGDLLNCSDAILQRAREINPLNTDHSANLGRLYRTRAEWASDKAGKDAFFLQSVDYYSQATSLSPNAAHLFTEWGLVYAIMRDYPAAIAKYEHSLEIDALYPNTYLFLGGVYMEMGELDKAKNAYLELVEINPRNADAHSTLAYLYGKEGRIEEAIAETHQVLELTGNKNLQYTSYKNLALFFQQLDRLDEAIKAAQEALIRAPEGERAAIQALIAQLSAGGAVSEADVMVQQFLAEGEAALNGKQWVSAEEAYNKALALDPNLVIAHSALAYIYAQQGRLEEAEKANHLVLAAVPNDYATLKNLAIIYRQMKRYEEAIQYAQQALDSPQATAEDKGQLQSFIDEVSNLSDAG